MVSDATGMNELKSMPIYSQSNNYSSLTAFKYFILKTLLRYLQVQETKAKRDFLKRQFQAHLQTPSTLVLGATGMIELRSFYSQPNNHSLLMAF